MSAPKRIQRKRTKGWRMPEGAVYVGRPTIYGNPFTLGNSICPGRLGDHPNLLITPTLAVALYRAYLVKWRAWDWLELAGKDLACWCPLDQPCHADVLLELANSGAS